MKRQFVTTRVIELELTTPFETVTDQIKHYLKSEPQVCGEHAKVLSYDVHETTTVDDIASSVKDEVEEIIGDELHVTRIGDNGDEDVGYEIMSKNSKRNVLDIGIMFKGGCWNVVADTSDGDVPLDDIYDVIDKMKKEIKK